MLYTYLPYEKIPPKITKILHINAIGFVLKDRKVTFD